MAVGPMLKLPPWPESKAAMPTCHPSDSVLKCCQLFRRHRLGRCSRYGVTLHDGGPLAGQSAQARPRNLVRQRHRLPQAPQESSINIDVTIDEYFGKRKPRYF